MELPDWLRGIVLLGRDGLEYRVVGVDANGYLGVILKAAAEVTIPGDVNVTQDDSIRQMQGDGVGGLQTVVVDAAGRLIMVPRGESGHYLNVDANGYLGAILKAAAEVTIPTGVEVTQAGPVTTEGTATVTQAGNVRSEERRVEIGRAHV